jgi:hypothetical protein
MAVVKWVKTIEVANKILGTGEENNSLFKEKLINDLLHQQDFNLRHKSKISYCRRGVIFVSNTLSVSQLIRSVETKLEIVLSVGIFGSLKKINNQ